MISPYPIPEVDAGPRESRAAGPLVAMMHFAKPENALRRADELISVGRKEDALVALHDVLSSKRHRTWQPAIEAVILRFLSVCVEEKKGKRRVNLDGEDGDSYFGEENSLDSGSTAKAKDATPPRADGLMTWEDAFAEGLITGTGPFGFKIVFCL